MNRSTRFVLAAVLALAVAVPAAVAVGGGPYRFSNRPRYEKAVAAQFVAQELRLRGVRFRVTGVGCAKTAIGHAICGLSATGPGGRRAFLVRVGCPSDTPGSASCSFVVTAEGRR